MHKHVHCSILCRELVIDNARNEQYKIDIYIWNFNWTFIFQFQLDTDEQQICRQNISACNIFVLQELICTKEVIQIY